MKPIATANYDFEKLITGGSVYVDKTDMLWKLASSKDAIFFISRPRRFGKSLMLSTFKYLFQGKRELFKGLKIEKKKWDWSKTYPVIELNMRSETASDLIGLEKNLWGIARRIADEYGLSVRWRDCGNSGKAFSLTLEAMAKKHGRFVLLIDEYDVPLAKASENRYYSKMLDVVRGIMSTSLKSNEYLKFAVVTGCLRIPKESIFTGVNNFSSYSVLDDEFSRYFGFTQDEIEKLLKYYDREDKIDDVRTWYDGYVFGNTEIYCPWDAMSYVSALRKNRNARPKPYWENTSGNGAIKAFFELGNEDVANQFETLLNGGTITENVTNVLTYDEAYTSVSNLWSVLLMTGYVTTVSRSLDSSGEEGIRGVELRIPNNEIAKMFQKVVVERFKQTVDQSHISALMSALWNGDESAASEILSNLLFETISYMDYNEDYYHAFIAGIFAGRGYIPQSNKEQGLGRPDVDLRDRRNRRMMIVECKISVTKEQMEYWCDEAIQQIKEQEYAKNTDGFNKVLCYGISFYKKSAKVKLMK